MEKRFAILFGLLILLIANPCNAASLEKADIMWEHGLISEAKLEYIGILYSNSNDNIKAEALYQLGAIAFEEKKINTSLKTWTQLVKKYPKSKQASIVVDRLKELSEIVGEISRSNVENVIAESYLRHAEFWSKEKDRLFNIDSSWIHNVEAAVKWYDKVIKEYPKSVASRVAYEGKMRAIIGWKDPGKYGQAHGIESDYNKYMPELLDTFAEYEKNHPTVPTLQAFRYQIAQMYWKHKDWSNTKIWLDTIINKSGPDDTFYKDLAQRRMQKVEY